MVVGRGIWTVAVAAVIVDSDVKVDSSVTVGMGVLVGLTSAVTVVVAGGSVLKIVVLCCGRVLKIVVLCRGRVMKTTEVLGAGTDVLVTVVNSSVPRQQGGM